MKYYKKLKLKKDLPELKAGTELFWDLWNERYTELSYIGLDDKPKVSYKMDFVNKHPDWFQPVGEKVELYEPFPEDFAEEHFYFGELYLFCKVPKKPLH